MKFKMGSNDPMRIERGPGAPPARPREMTSSNLYDVSKINGVKSPVNPVGHNASYYTKVRGAELEKQSQSNSEMLRGILIAIAVPFVIGAAYLAFSGDESKLSRFALAQLQPAEPEAPPETAGRAPAARAPLPTPKEFDLPTNTVPPLATMNSEGFSRPADAPTQSRPLHLVLDANGIMTAPYAIELDENGQEVARKEVSEQALFAPSLPLGEFENSKILSTTPLAAGDATVLKARPFVLTDADRRRVSELRLIAPEIKKALSDADKTSASRLAMAPFAIDSLNEARVPTKVFSEARAELQWMHAAALAHDVSGDRKIEKRMIDSLNLWAKTYKPSGDPLEEAPLIELVFAYNQIRPLLRAPDQGSLDEFFRAIVDTQFMWLKSQKQYDAAHAAHTLFALATGYVIENGAFQKHGLVQFKNHLARAPIFNASLFADDEVMNLHHLLLAAFVLERVGNLSYQNARLNQAVTTMATNAHPESKTMLIEAMAIAAYFRVDLYKTLPALAKDAGFESSRFGTNDGAIFAAIRKPTTSLAPGAQSRAPSAVPVKLPPKRP